MDDFIRKLGMAFLGHHDGSDFDDGDYDDGNDNDDYDDLDVDDNDIDELEDSASGVERSSHGNEISFGKKMCPTRHGCTGATSCNYAYADYPG